MPRRFASAVAVTALFVCSAVVGTALPVRSTSAATAPSVSVTVSCYANPEKVTVKNTKSSSITIKAVGSLYQPYSNEPFTVNKTLAAGASITYQTGGAASVNALTKRYIYNNDVGTREGTRVATSAGTVEKRCA